MKYFIGPIPWSVLPYPSFGIPAGAVGMIDLAPLPAQAKGGAARPMCVCWTGGAMLPSEYTLLGDGDCRELASTTAMQSAFKSLVGYKPNGDKLANLIMDCLQGGSDPTGNSGPLPIVPTADGWMDLWMPGHSRVLGEKFEWGRQGSRGSDHTPKLKQLLRAQFSQLMADAQAGKLKDSQHHRRVLDAWCDKYNLEGVDDWKELVPQNLQKDVPGRLKHETTITESFDRADSTTVIGNDLTWTQLSGTWGTFSNKGYKVATAGVVQSARAESDLSSADHYCQVVVGNAGIFHGPAARFNSSAETCYYSANFGNAQYIAKIVSGTNTNLANSAHTYADDETLKMECNGSSLKGYANGSQIVSVTDTAISGNLRFGLEQYGTNGTLDNLTAADLAVSGILYTQLERSTRGILRGMYTRF